MAAVGLYRRPLPSPPAIDFASPEGKEILHEAVLDGTMEGFFKLISYYQTQSEPAYCGLASLAMVLNALAIDPGRKWKGPWRWFDESMLDFCEPLDKVKAVGISFGKVVCLASCAGANVEAFRTNQSTIDDFREHVIRCSTSGNCHVISSYHRGVFKQTGIGHFSPIGGYHAGRDMALILDVARFKYPPHWVPLSLLWEAMGKTVGTTGLRRGFMILSKPQTEPGLLNNMSCKQESWICIAKYVIEELPVLLASEDVKDIDRVLHVVFTSLPSSFGDFIKWVAEVRTQEDAGENVSQEEEARLANKEEVLKQVRDTGLFKHVAALLCCTCSNMPTPGKDEDLSDMAADVCSQEAKDLEAKSFKICCHLEACIRYLKASAATDVNSDSSQQELQVLVPSAARKVNSQDSDPSKWNGMYPAGTDMLTALLLALPPETWSGIKDEKLLKEMCTLVSTDNLPILLHGEVLHLWRQLQLLKKCMRNEEEEEEEEEEEDMRGFTFPSQPICWRKINAVRTDDMKPVV